MNGIPHATDKLAPSKSAATTMFGLSKSNIRQAEMVRNFLCNGGSRHAKNAWAATIAAPPEKPPPDLIFRLKIRFVRRKFRYLTRIFRKTYWISNTWRRYFT